METSCLTKATFLKLCALIVFLANPVISTPLLPKDQERPVQAEDKLKTCLEALKSGTFRQPNGNHLATGYGSHTPVGSDPVTGIDCADVFEYPHGSGKLLSENTAESLETGFPTEQERADKGTSMESVNLDTPEAILRQAPQPLTRRSRGITNKDRGLMLKAHNVVSQLMEQMGVGASEDEKSRAAGSGESDNSLLLNLARLSVLAKLKKALTRANSQRTDLTDTLPLNPASSLPEALGAGESDRGNGGMDSPFPQSSGSSPQQQAEFPGAEAIERQDDDGLWTPNSEEGTESSAIEKRGGYRRWYSRTRFLQKRHRNTLSINNAMMAITNMLLEDQKERLQRNRERIRQHMLIQG